MGSGCWTAASLSEKSNHWKVNILCTLRCYHSSRWLNFTLPCLHNPARNTHWLAQGSVCSPVVIVNGWQKPRFLCYLPLQPWPLLWIKFESERSAIGTLDWLETLFVWVPVIPGRTLSRPVELIFTDVYMMTFQYSQQKDKQINL